MFDLLGEIDALFGFAFLEGGLSGQSQHWAGGVLLLNLGKVRVPLVTSPKPEKCVFEQT